MHLDYRAAYQLEPADLPGTQQDERQELPRPQSPRMQQSAVNECSIVVWSDGIVKQIRRPDGGTGQRKRWLSVTIRGGIR
jgi:hypothetical protein